MTIGIIGAGNIAGALARGWGEPVLISDAGSGRAQRLVAELGGEALTSNAEVAERAELLVLCHKPAQLDAVAEEIAGQAFAVVSVLGGTTLEDLRRAYPDAQVARAMPNTPAEVRRGVTCLAEDPAADPAFLALVHELFGRVGAVVTLPERLMGAATGLSGVFPAYVALVAEAQVDAGVRHGLPPATAAMIVIDALAGSAELLRARDGDTLRMRREVASPGGSTARGLAALERAGLRTAFSDAIDAVLGAPR